MFPFFTTGLCYICVFMHYVFVTAIYCINGMLTKCTCYISHKTPIHPYKPQWQTDWRIYANAFKYQFQPMTDLRDFGKHDSQSLITRIHYGGSVEPCAAQHGKKIPSLTREVISRIFVKIGEDERFHVATWYLTSEYMKGLISVFWKIAVVDIVVKTTPAVVHLRLFRSLCIKDEVLLLNAVFIYLPFSIS